VSALFDDQLREGRIRVHMLGKDGTPIDDFTLTHGNLKRFISLMEAHIEIARSRHRVDQGRRENVMNKRANYPCGDIQEGRR